MRVWFFRQILNADDRELNQWCSLKKTCMFRYWLCPSGSVSTVLLFQVLYCTLISFFFSLRSDKEEMGDLKNFKIKAQNEKKKKEILSSVYSE